MAKDIDQEVFIEALKHSFPERLIESYEDAVSAYSENFFFSTLAFKKKTTVKELTGTSNPEDYKNVWDVFSPQTELRARMKGNGLYPLDENSIGVRSWTAGDGYSVGPCVSPGIPFSYRFMKVHNALSFNVYGVNYYEHMLYGITTDYRSQLFISSSYYDDFPFHNIVGASFANYVPQGINTEDTIPLNRDRSFYIAGNNQSTYGATYKSVIAWSWIDQERADYMWSLYATRQRREWGAINYRSDGSIDKQIAPIERLKHFPFYLPAQYGFPEAVIVDHTKDYNHATGKEDKNSTPMPSIHAEPSKRLQAVFRVTYKTFDAKEKHWDFNIIYEERPCHHLYAGGYRTGPEYEVQGLTDWNLLEPTDKTISKNAASKFQEK